MKAPRTAKKSVEVYMSEAEKTLLEAAAVYREMSMSEFARYAIAKELERMRVYEKLREELLGDAGHSNG